MQSTELKIDGMTCRHCVMAVTRALRAVRGVSAVDVSLETGCAVVGGAVEPDELVRAVEREGYRAQLQH